MERIAPMFAVHDRDAAMEHYQRLGFAVRAYAIGGYGFASSDGTEIHLGVVPDDDRCTSGAYLFVDDADDLAAAWRSAGVELHSPQDTEWGAPLSTRTQRHLLWLAHRVTRARWNRGRYSRRRHHRS